jgi:drug/metabolite transporter (DMT)-like permease
LLSILCSTGIYLLFKISEVQKAGLKGIIIINYLFAAFLGFISGNFSNPIQTIASSDWLPIASLIGFLFVVMFFLIGLSARKAGVSVTAVATRMSMVFPVFFSMFMFNEIVTPQKIVLAVATLLAVFMAIYRNPEKTKRSAVLLLPFILFVGSGSVDTLVKTAQHNYIPPTETALFSATLFAISFLFSPLLLLLKKEKEKLFNIQTFIIGSALGLVNFGSLFFIIEALNKSNIDSSFVFGINNLAIVSLSGIMGYLLYKEKISKINLAGLALSFICIILLIKH